MRNDKPRYVAMMMRLPVELHREVVRRADREGVSRNRVVISALERATDDRLDRIEGIEAKLEHLLREAGVNAHGRRVTERVEAYLGQLLRYVPDMRVCAPEHGGCIEHPRYIPGSPLVGM